ncbi:hypothetical protein RQP46_007580 [Phenoliferia psychrophenolica]
MSSTPPIAAALLDSSPELTFPNEVLDEILGHLVTTMTPPTFQINLYKESSLEELQRVSLVSKQWRDVALRRIVPTLVVRNGSQARGLARLLDESGLGGLVFDLQFDGTGRRSKRVGRGRGQRPTPAAQTVTVETDSIGPEDVVALLRSTTRLVKLNFNEVEFDKFPPQDLATLATLPVVDTLESLRTTSARLYPYPENCEFIISLRDIFPYLIRIGHCLCGGGCRFYRTRHYQIRDPPGGTRLPRQTLPSA